ncbi:hypothetical protein [Nocardioides sp.]|nr:hypothetical protein [Nocardioides sp.]MDO9458132.1 hypothetical protein [Nocardioides sp.]
MSRFSELPAPIRLEDTITSEDAYEVEADTDRAVDEWLLKNAAG